MSFAIAHVGLTVSDLDTSVRWYSTLFGSPPAAVDRHEAYRFAVWVQPALGLHEFDSPPPATTAFDERNVGLDHVAFSCATMDELVRWEQRLDELGIVRGGIVEAWYGHALAFRDPDGIALEYFLPTPRPVSPPNPPR